MASASPKSSHSTSKQNFDKVSDIAKIDFSSSEQFTSDLPNDFLGFCINCGNSASIHISDEQGGIIGSMCLSCHNESMAGLTDTDMPAHIPKKLSFHNIDGKTSKFNIEFMIFATGKTLTATQVGKVKRKIDVFGELDDDFNVMFETLKSRIKKFLSVTYMQPNGYFVESKVVGYIEFNLERQACDVIIDGKPYTWSELEKNLSAHEGWKIKIEFGDVGDVLE